MTSECYTTSLSFMLLFVRCAGRDKKGFDV